VDRARGRRSGAWDRRQGRVPAGAGGREHGPAARRSGRASRRNRRRRDRGPDSVVEIPSRGEHDHRDLGLGSDPAQQLEAIAVGEPDVEDDKLRDNAPNGLEPARGVGGRNDRDALVPQSELDEVDDPRLVIDDQDRRRFRRRLRGIDRHGAIGPRPTASRNHPAVIPCAASTTGARTDLLAPRPAALRLEHQMGLRGAGEAPLGDGAGVPGSRRGAGHAQASPRRARIGWIALDRRVRRARRAPIVPVCCFTNNARGRVGRAGEQRRRQPRRCR